MSEQTDPSLMGRNDILGNAYSYGFFLRGINRHVYSFEDKMWDHFENYCAETQTELLLSYVWQIRCFTAGKMF